LVAFSGDSLISDVINIGTYGLPRWGASHVGIIARHGDRKLLFESTTLEGLPDEITGKPFNGTQAHQLEAVLAAYKGKVWHYPLSRPLFEFEDKRLSDYLLSTIHTPYDQLGAFRSGGIAFSWFESCLREEDMHSIFCSEWVAKALSEIGVMPTDNANRWNPNSLIRNLRRHQLILKATRLK
jgi:hypothetical protein